SLGKVLYAISTGKDPREFPDPITDIPDHERDQMIEMNAIILKACRNAARGRYQTANDLYDDLLALRSGRSPRRAKKIALASTVALILLASAAIAAWQFFGQDESVEGDNDGVQRVSEAPRPYSSSVAPNTLAPDEVTAG